MKHRVLVMNGQRIVQAEPAPGTWQTEHVDKAGALKPGIYNIYNATAADKAKAHEGVIIHADKQDVYQQIGKQFVKHDRQNFDKVPEIGSAKSISYDQSGRAKVAVASENLGRKLSR
jgi:KfrB protein